MDPALGEGIAKDLCDRDIGIDRITAALEDHSAARLKAQRERIRRHIGAGLVDHADHAHGNADLADLHAIRTCELLHDFSHRIGELCHLAQALRDLSDPALCQGQPVDESLIHSGSSAGFDIFSVGRKDGVLSLHELLSRCIECLVLLRPAEFLNIILDSGSCSAKIFYNTHDIFSSYCSFVYQFPNPAQVPFTGSRTFLSLYPLMLTAHKTSLRGPSCPAVRCCQHPGSLNRLRMASATLIPSMAADMMPPA